MREQGCHTAREKRISPLFSVQATRAFAHLKRQICGSSKAMMHHHTGRGHDAPPRFGDAGDADVVLELGLR